VGGPAMLGQANGHGEGLGRHVRGAPPPRVGCGIGHSSGPHGGDASEGQRPVPPTTATPTTSGPWERHTYVRSKVEDAGAVWAGEQCGHPSERGHGLCHACVGGTRLPSVEAGHNQGQGQPPRPRGVSETSPGVPRSHGQSRGPAPCPVPSSPLAPVRIPRISATQSRGMLALGHFV
jgi:hypothetical protein